LSTLPTRRVIETTAPAEDPAAALADMALLSLLDPRYLASLRDSPRTSAALLALAGGHARRPGEEEVVNAAEALLAAVLDVSAEQVEYGDTASFQAFARLREAHGRLSEALAAWINDLGR
jgi:hypothetical protein